MISRPRVSRFPGSPSHGPDEGMTVQLHHAFVADGVQFAPCQRWSSGMTVMQNGSKAIVAMISSGDVGLAAAFTPEGARLAANCLIRLAQMLEDEAAVAAAEALEKARRSGGAS